LKQHKIKIFQIDAFTSELFRGNPACVIPLQNWLSDDLLLKIAEENAVPETAFFVIKNKTIQLRWFTPDLEMDLCGHATLATAHCLIKQLNYPSEQLEFHTLSGILKVTLKNEIYYLDFPSRPPKKANLPKQLLHALSLNPIEVYKARDYMLVYENEQQLREIKINRMLFDQINLGTGGVILTAPGMDVDFVSRFFTPQATLLEDPVTGSAHCSLIPFWANQIQKKKMSALQLSRRGGKLWCQLQGERVLIGGKARTYLEGQLLL
jgi:PhzF family phenazine biosynthesis protein